MEIFGILTALGFTDGKLTVLMLGVFIGWCVPQPEFAKPMITFVHEKINQLIFQKNGVATSDETSTTKPSDSEDK